MILVSIAVLTYNHESFIRKALDGFLSQEINFKLEIIIGDDASKDSTQSILKEYENKYPDKFKIFYRDINIGMLPNFSEVLKSCSGKYIAFCEGDDYWVDPLKLQKQVDFLESNESYSICFHDVLIFDESVKEYKEDYITQNKKNIFDIDDLASGNFMHTPSVMLRNDFIVPENFNESPIGDWPLYFLQIKDRKIRKIEGKMSVYRVHENGVWSTKSKRLRFKSSVKVISYILNNMDLPESVRKELRKQRGKMKRRLRKTRFSFYVKIRDLFRVIKS